MWECWNAVGLQAIVKPATRNAKLNSRSGSFKTGVEKIAQRIAKQVDAEDGDENTETRKKRHPPRCADVDTGVREHGAPGGNLRRYAYAEEAQARFGDNRRRHGKGADDE